MKFRVLELVFVTTVAFLSWISMFSLECYFGNSGIIAEIQSERNSPPFPDHHSDNIFWFVQVKTFIYR